MYLKSLEIQGFKSFADKTVLHFDSDITAIVGPNGSGKSNISDAISWVMGEMSSKALRGAKMEDVIFGGTQKRSQLGFAEASLILDNSDGSLPVDTPEVMVTRRYYRSGESEYYINRQSARLRDINEMFMDTGLGKEGYSNIGQGRIDEILAVKSTDRREVFEEAAGISKYRHRKEETERRLASTEDNLTRIGDKISELELQVEPLRVQAEKAKKYLSLRETLKGLEIALWLQNLERLAAAAKKAEGDYAAAARTLEEQHAALNRLYQLSDQLALKLNQANLELEQQRHAIAGQEAVLHQQESESAVLKAGAENTKQNIERVRRELEDQESRSGGVSGQIAEQEARIAQLAATLAETKDKLQQAQDEAARLLASADEAEGKTLTLRTRQAALQQEAAGKRAEAASLRASLDEVSQRKASVEEDLTAALARQTELGETVNTCKETLAKAKEAVEAHRNADAGYALRLNARVEKRDRLKKALDAQNIELQTVRSRGKMLAELQRDYEGFSKAVRLVMQEAKGGRLGEIYGPVSARIRTEDDYTVAIETALGGAMQNIVVGSEADGKAAIRYLKRCDGGRATFLPRSTVRGKELRESGLAQCPGFVGIASELVRCDIADAGIISSLLGRIVLVETLDHAVDMARKYQNRFKIVTLDGQVMNPGGSMTGGSASKSAGILSRANELQRLAQRAKALEAEIAQQDAALAEAARAAAQVEFERTALQGKLRQAEDDVLRAEGELQKATALYTALSDTIESYRRELASVAQRTGGDLGRLSQLEQDASAAEAEAARLEAALAEETQGQTALSQQMNEQNEAITALRMELAAREAEDHTARESVERLRALAEAMAGDRAQKEKLIASYEADAARLARDIEASEKKREELERTVENARLSLQEAIAARSETEGRRNRTDKEAQEKNKEILDMEREAARLEQKKAAAAMEEQQILDKLWESYELTPSTAAKEAAEIESAPAAAKQITDLKRKISSLGTPNLGAIDEFERVNERYGYLTGQRDDVLHAKKELENIIKTITQEMTEIFVREFGRINQYFGETFQEMFGGGKGELVLEEPDEPLSCGIEIKVQPPGKQVKTITLLSGGEKAFVAIALYFAILKVRPTPFCLLDEIDAALDDRNVERFASYLRNFSSKTQFLIITHRRGTMEAADVLYGVTMVEQGVSRILHLDLNQMQAELGITD